jgi:hypothetical protein
VVKSSQASSVGMSGRSVEAEGRTVRHNQAVLEWQREGEASVSSVGSLHGYWKEGCPIGSTLEAAERVD